MFLRVLLFVVLCTCAHVIALDHRDVLNHIRDHRALIRKHAIQHQSETEQENHQQKNKVIVGDRPIADAAKKHGNILWIVCNPCALPAGVNVATMRTRVTGGPPAANAGPLNDYTYEINGAPGGVATFPVQGTVSRAYGWVPAVPGPESEPSEAASAFCDATWYYSGIGANTLRTGDYPNGYQTGHIVAAQLNGHNDEPLNFFPHNAVSNTKGVWYRFEMIARHTRNVLEKVGGLFGVPGHPGVATCLGNSLEIDIHFNYNANYNMIPSGGTYAIRIVKACADSLRTVTPVQFNGFATAPNNNWAKAAYRWVTGPGTAPGVYMPGVAVIGPAGADPAKIQVQYNWVNTGADAVGTPGTGVGATHPLLYW